MTGEVSIRQSCDLRKELIRFWDVNIPLYIIDTITKKQERQTGKWQT